MADQWGDAIGIGHAHRLKDAFTQANKKAWCYFVPFLQAFSLPPNRVVRILKRDGCVCVLVERPEGVDLLVPPLPFKEGVLRTLLSDLALHNGDRTTRILWVDETDAAHLKDLFVLTHKDAEYIYDPALIVRAEGRAFRDLRKRLNRFGRENNACFRPMLAEDVGACHDLLRYWRKRQGRRHPFLFDWGYTRAALDAYADWPDELLKGWCVEMEGQVEAFALTGEIQSEMAQFFVAKANPDVFGLSEYLRWQVFQNLTSYPLVNDAGDLDLVGMRQFKMKFRPVAHIQVFSAELRKEAL